MAKVPTLVLYRPKDGRENDLLAILKKHAPALRAAKLADREPAKLFHAADKRTGRTTFVERFAWADETASSRAHHNKKVQAVWGAMDGVLEDMTILQLDDVNAKAAKKTAAKKKAPAKKARAPKRATARRRR